MFSDKESLRQMSLRDKGKLLSKLSKCDCIGYVENLFLVSSFEDGYAPSYSANITDQDQSSQISNLSYQFWNKVKVTLQN